MALIRSLVLVILGTITMAVDSCPQAQPNSPVSITYSTSQNILWVRECTNQYPEILWLADRDVRKTEEGQATSLGSYSEQLFGQKFIEFDRTIMTLHCLRLILDGSENAYLEFTKDQPKDTKLSRSSFELLHSQGMELLHAQYQGITESEMVQAMEVALVLGDIGKSEKAREIFRPYGATAPDHDDFHGEAMAILQAHPELCPSFQHLNHAVQDLLILTANLAHYGHITHLEGGLGMFTRLRQSKIASSSVALGFDLFVHLCDVAGALGHVNHDSSIVYTEPSHLAIQAMENACKVFINPKATELDAYNSYLTVRAQWLGLSPHDPIDRVLARIGAMVRLFTPEDGRLLKAAIQQLDLSLRNQIMATFDVSEDQPFERTPTYMPAVLVNLSNNPQLGSSREERLTQTVLIGMPFLARVLTEHQRLVAQREINPNIPLNFNKAAGTAKENPKALLGQFTIDQEGNVQVARL